MHYLDHKFLSFPMYNKSSIVRRYLHGFLNFANVELETRSSFQYNNSNTKQWYCILAPYKKNMECAWCHGFRGIGYWQQKVVSSQIKIVLNPYLKIHIHNLSAYYLTPSSLSKLWMCNKSFVQIIFYKYQQWFWYLNE